MDKNMDNLFAFRAITRLTCNRDRIEQQLHTLCAWMLIGRAGVGTVAAGQKRHIVSSAGAVVGGPGSITLYAEENVEAWELFFIEFIPFTIVDETKAEASRWTECRHTPYSGELGELAERLFSVVHVWPETLQRSLTAHILIQQMLLWWQNEEKDKRGHQHRPTEQAVLATLRYMESHFAEMPTREQLAAKAGIAHTYFSVLCKKVTGISPSVYLERLRVHRAAELLLEARNGRGDLEEISRQAGFRDPWYMSKRFRKIHGVSPSAYRSDFVPERPVSLQYPYTHHLIALGIRPAAASFSRTNSAAIASALETTVELPRFLSIEGQKEWLQDIRPQVILTYDGESVRERLRELAPVVHIPWLSMNWREHMKTIGRLFHKEAAASACIEDLDRQAARIRQEVHARIAPGTIISIFKIAHDRCFLYGNRDAGCIFYEFLGFTPPPYVQQCTAQDSHFHSAEISMSRITEFAGDLNIFIVYPNDKEHIDYLRMNEHWNRYELTGRPTIYLDYREWLHYDPIHMADQLQQIAPILLAPSLTI